MKSPMASDLLTLLCMFVVATYNTTFVVGYAATRNSVREENSDTKAVSIQAPFIVQLTLAALASVLVVGLVWYFGRKPFSSIWRAISCIVPTADHHPPSQATPVPHTKTLDPNPPALASEVRRGYYKFAVGGGTSSVGLVKPPLAHPPARS